MLYILTSAQVLYLSGLNMMAPILNNEQQAMVVAKPRSQTFIDDLDSMLLSSPSLYYKNEVKNDNKCEINN